MIATKGVNRIVCRESQCRCLMKFFQLTIHYAIRLSRHALALTIRRVAKLKIRQYVLGSDSMLTKISRYTVYTISTLSKLKQQAIYS